jgi:molecular chaperone GrpE
MTNGNGHRDDNAILSAENEGMDEAVGKTQSDLSAQAANILAEQVTALEKERDALKDNLLRALAETDNVRKRANRQIEDARLYAVEKFARDLLNVSDNLARAVESVPAQSRGIMTDAVKTALEGVELTQKELVVVLSRHGVTPIDASPGAAFDPALHQAVTQVPSTHPAGSVAEMFQSGWRIGDRTLRAAMVSVSAGPGKVQ